ncbi:hypothetical protein MACK_000169 [Theileria orientalis]|uniref:Serine hydrolase domain-containing protein n=1 Tax=Theileria orientalis TaxID=68886 RepID=A0A976M936_THEOR|nr:hypothetical protein MACK_000169 [Theileria orientalis]
MKFKALFLHGLTQDSKIIANEASYIKGMLSKILDLTYIDAPYTLDSYPVFCHVTNEKTDEELRKMESMFRDNYYKKHGRKETYGGTWYYTDVVGAYSPQMKDVPIIGMEKSVDFVLDECKKANYDGLVGFSQGSLISTLLAKKLSNESNPGWKPKFCLLFSCPMPYTCTLKTVLTTPPKIPVPSLHVLGKNDKLVPNARSLMLADCYNEPMVHYHDGGHHVPYSDEVSTYEKFFANIAK